jgi:hypothetical protein
LTPSYLTSGAFTKIFVDMDTVSSMLARLLSNLDEFPDPTAVSKTSGPSASVAAKYSKALGDAADRASQATKLARDELLGMDQTIREVVAALAAQDTGAVADAERLNKVLDDAAADAAADETATADATTTANVAFGTLP